MSDLSLPPLTLVPIDEALHQPQLPDAPVASGVRSEPFAWPTPRLAAYPSPACQIEPEPCVVEARSGSFVSGLLTVFEPHDGIARVQVVGEKAAMPLRFAQIRRLTLKRPLRALALPVAADGTLDPTQTPVLAHQPIQPYEVQLVGGTVFKGRTITHVETDAGLFLFDAKDEHGSVERHFIPKVTIEQFRIGERLGDLLAEGDDEKGRQIEQGLEAQKKLRAQKLGDILLARQVVTPEQLLQALDKQARMPLVRLGDALVALGFADEAQLQSALRQQEIERNQPLGEVLVQRGLVNLEQVRVALARKMGYPVVDVSTFTVDAEALRLVPQEVARRLAALPLLRRGGRLVVALQDAARDDVLATLQQVAQCDVLPALAGSGDLQAAIERAYRDAQAAAATAIPDFPVLTTELLDVPPSVRPAAAARLPGQSSAQFPTVPQPGAAAAAPAAANGATGPAAAPSEPVYTPAPVTTAGAFHSSSMPFDATASRSGRARGTASGELDAQLAAAAAPALAQALAQAKAKAARAASAAAPQASDSASTDSGLRGRARLERPDSPVVQALVKLVCEGLAKSASSIHLECQPGESGIQVRLRRDGKLEAAAELPAALRGTLIPRIKALAELDVRQTRRPQQGRLSFGRLAPAHRIDLAITTLPSVDGLEDLVIGLPAQLKPMKLDGLGLSADNLERWSALLARPSGLILHAIPAHQGRTTTLHAELAHLSRPERRLWAIESRVELTQPGVRQMELRPGSGMDVEQGLRALTQADADVIMVADLREASAAHAAVQAALSGRLVLAAVPARSAADALMRLLDQGVQPWDLADALLGVHSQRLVRRLCSACRMSRPAKDNEIEEWLDAYLYGSHVDDLAAERQAVQRGWVERFGREGKLRRFQSPGCERCGSTGHRSRTAVHEVLVVGREIRRLLRAGAPAWNLQRQALKDGMKTLRQDAIEKMLAGQLPLDAVRALVQDL